MKALVSIVLLALSSISYSQSELRKFYSLDSIIISSDLYAPHHEKAPFIIFCHQDASSRGEYIPIAPLLVKKGYNCLAIDQRKGNTMSQVDNETYYQAAWGKRLINYLTSEQDIIASIDYVKLHYPKAKKIILWGSSYSASLCLKIASERKDIDAVIAFSPGEYFKKEGESNHYIRDYVKDLCTPTLILGANYEEENAKEIFDVIPARKKTLFIHKTTGSHGSKSFWEITKGHQEYHEAVYHFLKKSV